MAFPNVLDYYAQINSSFLHGAGLKGTQHLLSAANFAGTETVFELGAGTGASLVLLAHNFPAMKLQGGDLSPLMLAKAKKRIRISGFHKRIQLHHLAAGENIPLSTDQVDAVWIESVLGIQEKKELRRLLEEIKRILTPNGKLLLNETLWLPTVSKTERQRINAQCREHFGIMQANENIATLQDWSALLTTYGFELSYQAPAHDWSELAAKQILQPNFYSRAFDALGKVRRRFHPRFRREAQALQQLEKQIMGNDEQKLSAYVIVAKRLT